MDIKKVESVAVPTALSAVAAGGAGYILPKTINNGKLADEFVKYAETTMRYKDMARIDDAVKLSMVNPVVSEEEVAALGTKNFRKNFLKLVEKKSKKANKAVEKFVRKYAEDLGIKPAEKQTMKEAVKEYINGKTIDEICEAVSPRAYANSVIQTDYKKLLKDYFNDNYDINAKKFKADEAGKEAEKFFKRAAKDMKVHSALIFVGAAGLIALVSSSIANRISNK